MASKRQRQQLIRALVAQQAISSQRELAEALSRLGCPATQATVSRDLRELGLHKRRDSRGRPRYIPPGSEEKRDPIGACARMLGAFGRGVLPAQNVIVIRCDPGTAPGMGRVVDELEDRRIVGCVAGDDTVIIVTQDAATAEVVSAYLRELGG